MDKGTRQTVSRIWIRTRDRLFRIIAARDRLFFYKRSKRQTVFIIGARDRVFFIIGARDRLFFLNRGKIYTVFIIGPRDRLFL